MPPFEVPAIKRLSLFFHACKDIIFPARCLQCMRLLPCWELPLFCNDCLAGIAYINSPLCAVCGMPFRRGGDHVCGQCRTRPFSFQLARSALHYREPVPSLISALKFNGDLTVLATLARLAVCSPGFAMLASPDLILPVPLHKDRLRQRGYNQALLLARAIFPDSRRKTNPSLLVRNRSTTPQTGLSGIQRRRNLSKAFSVIRPEMLERKKILLVDDVFTTGSTVNECARTLYRHGAARVEVFTVARAL